MRRNVVGWFLLGVILGGTATLALLTAYLAMRAGAPPAAIVTGLAAIVGIATLSHSPLGRPQGSAVRSREVRCRAGRLADERLREHRAGRHCLASSRPRLAARAH